MSKYTLHIKLDNNNKNHRFRLYTFDIIESFENFSLVSLTSADMLNVNHVDGSSFDMMFENKPMKFDLKNINKVIALMALKFDKKLNSNDNVNLFVKEKLEIIAKETQEIEEVWLVFFTLNMV